MIETLPTLTFTFESVGNWLTHAVCGNHKLELKTNAYSLTFIFHNTIINDFKIYHIHVFIQTYLHQRHLRLVQFVYFLSINLTCSCREWFRWQDFAANNSCNVRCSCYAKKKYCAKFTWWNNTLMMQLSIEGISKHFSNLPTCCLSYKMVTSSLSHAAKLCWPNCMLDT